jgi:LPXTG-motif cell wall-anchored protein
MNFSRIILSLFLFFAAYSVVAQDVSIKTTVDKNKILIGEPLQLTVETNFRSTATALSFVQIDSIEHFEFLGKPVTDTLGNNEEITIRSVYRITSFDSGQWVIPSFVLYPGVQTESIPVDVVFSDFDPNQEYHDIKDIIEVKPKKKTPWWWYVAAGGLLVLLALIYFLRKKKPAPVKPAAPVISLNAYEEAMKELDELQRSKPDPKTFYSKLTGIFRLYVYRRKGVLSLQKTTDDLVIQLKGLDLGKDQLDKLAQALRLSDFVKFAKYIPSKDDDAAAFETIKNSITNIEKSEAQVLPLGRI